jgi:hypothetical protein
MHAVLSMGTTFQRAPLEIQDAPYVIPVMCPKLIAQCSYPQVLMIDEVLPSLIFSLPFSGLFLG